MRSSAPLAVPLLLLARAAGAARVHLGSPAAKRTLAEERGAPPAGGPASAAAASAEEGALWYPFRHGGDRPHSAPGSSLLQSPRQALCRQETPLLGTMKSPAKLGMVLDAAEKLLTAQVPGAFVEAGVAEGGGILPVIFYLACTGMLEQRVVFLFDTWEGLPPPDNEADTGFTAGAYHVGFQGFLRNVQRFAAAYGELSAKGLVAQGQPRLLSWGEAWRRVRVVKGLFADTMEGSLKGVSVALLQCDGDMYGSTKDCLKAGAKHVVRGGAIYNDDYYTFSGCYEAVQEYVAAEAAQGRAIAMQLVSEDGMLRTEERAAHCTPPTSNSGADGGQCSGHKVEAGLFYVQG